MTRRPGKRRFHRLRRLARRSIALCLLAAIGLLLLWVLFPFPDALLELPPESPAIYDRDGRPVMILAAADGRWRLPVPLSRVSPHLIDATIAVEDARYHSHPGVDPAAAVRAVGQAIGSRRVISGASTITMQLCRMLEPRPRDIRAKAIEALRALQVERLLTKEEILERYLNLAPYGGGIHGVEAASRIWFGKSAAELNLSEAALLAGLPQSPTRYRPDLHPWRATSRRNRVLLRMREEGMIDEASFKSATGAPLRTATLAGAGARLGRDTGRHAAFWALFRRRDGGRTTLDLDVQAAVETAAREHARRLPPESDVAVVVIDIETAEVRALVGSADFQDPVDGQVNGATAMRSPGSALKPFLYGAAFATGRLGPDDLVPDRPIDRAGWRPENFTPGFAGDLSAAECLRRSLNLPALVVTEAAGPARCAGVLRAAGIPLPDEVVGQSGLTLATGGVEVRLTDLANAYATIGRGGVHRAATLFPDEDGPASRALPARVCAALDTILSCRKRVPAGLEGRRPTDIHWFMWKTGTSSGRRDAVAVGHNRRYAVGVWAGRFSGAGHVNLTGSRAAEPLLARIFQIAQLATEREPAAEPGWKARRSLFTGRQSADPKIHSPQPGAVYLALEGRALVHPESGGAADATWFLNGRRLGTGSSPRLELPPGRYELRLVTAAGAADAATFTVR